MEKENIIVICIIIMVCMSCLMIMGGKIIAKNYDECYEYICVKTNLDQFENCKKLGYESTGFLSGEVYHLCDGIKVVEECIERKEVISNVSREFIWDYSKCEKFKEGD